MIVSPITRFADVEGVDFCEVSPGGFDHFPGAGAPRGCIKETEGLGLWFSPGERKVRGFRLGKTGLSGFSAPAGFFCEFGLAHFEIGGAHFPRPAGEGVASGDSGSFDLLLGTSHPSGRALICAKQRVNV